MSQKMKCSKTLHTNQVSYDIPEKSKAQVHSLHAVDDSNRQSTSGGDYTWRWRLGGQVAVGYAMHKPLQV